MRTKPLRKYLPVIGMIGIGVGLYLLTRKPKPKQAATASKWVDQNLFGGGPTIADQRLNTLPSFMMQR